MTSKTLDPTAIMVEHHTTDLDLPEGDRLCVECATRYPCLYYRLAAELDRLHDVEQVCAEQGSALAAARKRERRVSALMERSVKSGTFPTTIDLRDLMVALAGEKK